MKRVIYSGAGLLLIALAFLAFNILSGLSLTNARLDLTEQKLYTISDGTRRILEGLDEPIELKFFYSDEAAKDLVALRNYARRVEEMLRAYERAAGGKLKLQVIDPEPFSEAEDQAAGFGLQGVPLDRGGDKVYFGLAASGAGDKDSVIPFLQPERERFLEYDITKLIFEKKSELEQVHPAAKELDPKTALTSGASNGNWVTKADLSKVDEIGFTDLMAGAGHGAGGSSRISWIEVYGNPVKRDSGAAQTSSK